MCRVKSAFFFVRSFPFPSVCVSVERGSFASVRVCPRLCACACAVFRRGKRRGKSRAERSKEAKKSEKSKNPEKLFVMKIMLPIK